MLMVKTLTPVELRGVSNKQTKKGETYYLLNVETADGLPYSVYCPTAEVLPQGLRKGDMIEIDFEVRKYLLDEKLVARVVCKVE